MAEVKYLSDAEGKQLLTIARRSLEAKLLQGEILDLPLAALPAKLQADGASFVTLTQNGMLRGCIGSPIAYQPLALDVRDNAVKAALQDPRFPPLPADELPRTAIEVSVLTPLQPLPFRDVADLLRKLRPGVDGVLLTSGWNRGLFLPQVWHQLPDPAEFLQHLFLKAGLPADSYRYRDFSVEIFQVQEFHESPDRERTQT